MQCFFDLPLEELRKYKPPREEPQDFDEFWNTSLAETRSYPLNCQLKPVDYGLHMLDCFDVTFNGYAGQPVKGWFLLPKIHSKEIVCIVQYIGYGGGRGFPLDWLLWPSAGYAVFVMDTRGQGSSWLKGDTPDLPSEGSSPHFPGFLTLGILNPKTYYYRRLILDAVRAVEAARSVAGVYPRKIALSGGSQGGGITLAVSGLQLDVAVIMPDVPFLCHFKRAVGLTDERPYNEISTFCKAQRDQVGQVFKTLAYFDGMHFAARAKAAALFSVGLMDAVCPPSTIFAAYNHYAGRKEIRVYDFNRHEGGESHHEIEKIKFLQEIFK